MELIYHSVNVLLGTVNDILPIIGVVVFFQLLVIKKKIENLGRLVYGSILVVIGLAVFLVGLEEGLFPLGESMSKQLTNFHFLAKGNAQVLKHIESTGIIHPSLYFLDLYFCFFNRLFHNDSGARSDRSSFKSGRSHDWSYLILGATYCCSFRGSNRNFSWLS